MGRCYGDLEGKSIKKIRREMNGSILMVQVGSREKIMM